MKWSPYLPPTFGIIGLHLLALGLFALTASNIMWVREAVTAMGLVLLAAGFLMRVVEGLEAS